MVGARSRVPVIKKVFFLIQIYKKHSRKFINFFFTQISSDALIVE
jgi:hypothetical protein